MSEPTSMTSARTVTVYCSSSTTIAPVYFDAGRELGRAIAANGWTLVYGGNRVGLMGALADAAREQGGRVVGITPQLFIDRGVGDEACHEMLVAESMRHRKALLEERGDAFVALPGGLGTFEEIFEIIVGRSLGYHDKPIVFLNIGGYYDPLLTMIEHGIERHFIKPAARELYFVTDSVAAAIGYLRGDESPAPAPPILPSARE